MSNYIKWTPELDILANNMGFEGVLDNHIDSLENITALSGPHNSGKRCFINNYLLNPLDSRSSKIEVLEYDLDRNGSINLNIHSNKNNIQKFGNSIKRLIQNVTNNTSIDILGISTPTLSNIKAINLSDPVLIIIYGIGENIISDNFILNLIEELSIKKNFKFILISKGSFEKFHELLKAHSVGKLNFPIHKFPRLTIENYKNMDFSKMRSAEKVQSDVINKINELELDFKKFDELTDGAFGNVLALLKIEKISNKNEQLHRILINSILEDVFPEKETSISSEKFKKELFEYLDYYIQIYPFKFSKKELKGFPKMNSIDNLSEYLEVLRKKGFIIPISENPRYSKINNVYKDYSYSINNSDIKDEAIDYLSKTIKEITPWDYQIREKIELKKENSNDNESELFEAMFLARNISTLVRSQIDYSENCYHEELDLLKEMYETPDSVEVIGKAILMNAPDILQSEINLGAIKLAKKLKDDSACINIIQESVNLYENLKRSQELDAQFHLGIVIAADIQNYGLSQYYEISKTIFGELDNVLKNSSVTWTDAQNQLLNTQLVLNKGVQNNIKIQIGALKAVNDLNDDYSIQTIQNKNKILTNIVGLYLYTNERKETVVKYQKELCCTIHELSEELVKSINNYLISSFYTGDMTSKEIIQSILSIFYNSDSLKGVVGNSIPNNSHVIMHLNLAILLAVEKDYVNSKKLLKTVELEHISDNFYEYYIEYNRILIDFAEKNINSKEVVERITKLIIPDVLLDSGTDEKLKVRNKMIVAIINDEPNINFKELSKKFIERIGMISNYENVWIDNNIYLMSDIQFWN